MGRHIAACAAAAALLILAGQASAGYGMKVSGATETGRVYHANNWDAEIIWHATFMSDRFRQAYEQRYAKLNHFDQYGALQFAAEQDLRQRRGWEFYIGIYTKDRYKEFTTYEDSFWKIKLVTGLGEEVAPITVEQVPITPLEENLFPYLDRWSRLFRVVFPKVALGDRIELTAYSVIGESTLKWRLN
jgi:hypothetical protein